ncbi:MAG: LysR substrate-binding domain-containing protein [Acetobacteraceae bacterium]
MTLKQLQLLREIVRQSLNISAAAAVLGTSQPGISRQIQQLEHELGVLLLVRRRNRVVALTEAGSQLLDPVLRLLNEVENIGLIAAEARQDHGRLVVATSHLHARYTLMRPFQQLRAAHPTVELLLLQVEPDEIARLVAAGKADIGVGTEEDADTAHPVPSPVPSPLASSMVVLAGEVLRRSAIMPPGHALARRRRLSLQEIAAYPIIGYEARSRSGQLIARAFTASGITPRYVVRASDSDVIKAYVAQGLGVGIVPTLAIGGADRGRLGAVDVTALLAEARTTISLRRDMYLRRHVIDFIRMVSPAWDRAAIRRAIERHN